MKLKSLATAVLLVSAGGASGALLKDGITPGTPSDLLLAIYDDSTGLASSGKTFLFNTQVSYGDIVNGTVTSKLIDLSGDPNFQALKVSGAKLKFNIVGGYSLANNFSNYDKTGASGRPFTDPSGAQWGVVTTGHSVADFNGEFTNLSDTTKNRIFAYWNATNAKLAEAGATTSAGPNSVLVPPGDPQASFDLAWRGNFGGGGIANTATANRIDGFGQNAKFFWVTNTDFDQGTVVELGNWTLSEAGQLTYAGGGGGGGGGNQPPVANAGPAQTVAVGTVVTLNGSGSSDPDNGPQPLSYAWTQEAGPPVTLAGATTAQATFTPAQAGVYGFKLTVSDGQASATAQVTITVEAPTVQPPIKLDVPATWRVGQKQFIKWITTSDVRPNRPVNLLYSKNGVKFTLLKSPANKKGAAGVGWKPVKGNLLKKVTTNGALRACVKPTAKLPKVCDTVNIVVEPKQR